MKKAERIVSEQLEDRVSISEQAYQHLRSLIIEQVLEPGTIVAERRLAEQLNASRTPLRAAIGRLEGERLVERLSNGSLIIRQISTDELLDILLVRRLLEAELRHSLPGRLRFANSTGSSKRRGR